MAPVVLAKGVAYDSSADWFSLGCMMFKLLKGYVNIFFLPKTPRKSYISFYFP
jgi:hypothetical protein